MKIRWCLFALAIALVMSPITYAETFVEAEEDAPLTAAIAERKEDAVFLQIGNYAAVSDGVLTWIDRDNKEVRPYIKDDRTMVPLRFLTEAMGAVVEYDSETRGVAVTLGDAVMALQIGEAGYTLNGQAFSMDCAPEISADRTFVPVRFVSEALGKAVAWLSEERIVVITSVTYPWNEDNDLEKIVISEIQLSLAPIGRDRIQ